MSIHITFYCPDRHILYDRFDLMDKTGLGGGATARFRLAQALARQGHQVQFILYCKKGRIHKGVQYIPLEQVKGIQTDVLIASSSGGQLDLSPMLAVPIEAKIKTLWVHGTPQLGGIDQIDFSYIYTPSNFIRQVVQDEWGIPPSKLFVFHNGLEEKFYQPGFLSKKPVRDPYRIGYCGHLSKGLDVSIAILNLLRKQDKRFHLHVFGGDRLYGAKDMKMEKKEGVIFRGTIGQYQLAQELQRCTFDLHLQQRLEPFGITLIEAMRAGCITLASIVGAYPEIIQNGRNGFLQQGDCTLLETQQAAADLILELSRSPEWMTYVRSNAVKAPLSWDILARSWIGHWYWMMNQPQVYRLPSLACLKACDECGQYSWLPLADGYHCIQCGFYQRIQ